jgi:hypothetical protein
MNGVLGIKMMPGTFAIPKTSWELARFGCSYGLFQDTFRTQALSQQTQADPSQQNSRLSSIRATWTCLVGKENVSQQQALLRLATALLHVGVADGVSRPSAPPLFRGDDGLIEHRSAATIRRRSRSADARRGPSHSTRV